MKTKRLAHLRVSVVRDSAPAKGAPIVEEERPIRDAEEAARLVLPYLRVDSGRESFIALMLDTRHSPIGVVTVSVGSLNASIVHPREVFRPAIIAGACALILAHNHPSGVTTPSEDDIEITRRLCKVGELVGIEVLDHVILGNDRASTDCFSLRQAGLMR